MTHFSNCSYSSIQKIRNRPYNRSSSTNRRCKYTIKQVSHKTGDLMIICSIHFPGRCDGLLHKIGDLMIICSIHFPGRCDGLLHKIGTMHELLILLHFRFQTKKEK